MLKTKQQIDLQVRSNLSNLKSERERNLRGLSVAGIYYKAGHYDIARQYVSNYMSVKENSSAAYKLLGQCLDAQGLKEKAFAAYKTSMELEPKQPELLMKVCEMLVEGDVALDPERARYWCEKAEAEFSSNNTVFKLKEKLLVAKDSKPSHVKELILKELDIRPADPTLRIRLLQHLLQENLIEDAYKHAYDIEFKNYNIFEDNLDWYDTLGEILQKFQFGIDNSQNLNWEFWLFNLIVLEKIAHLSLTENNSSIKNLTDCLNAISNFDQALNNAAKIVTSLFPERELATQFLNHFRGQLCFHIATFIYKRAKKHHQNMWKEKTKLCAPLLLLAFHTTPPDLQETWLSQTTENNRQILQRWNREGSYRCSQAGQILLASIKEKRAVFVDRISNNCIGQWREKLFKELFTGRQHLALINTSYFVNCSYLSEPPLRLPATSEIKSYNDISQRQYPNSLHHLVWIGLSCKHLSDIKCMIFDGLQFSVNNLTSCSLETLSRLDVDAFLYCCIIRAQANLDDSMKRGFISSEKPVLIPANIMERLCTTQQADWWESCYKLYKNQAGSDIGDLRVLLNRGIETVRCVGQHGLDAKVLYMLANAFYERSKRATNKTEKSYLEARTQLYYTTAIPLLERIKNNQSISSTANRLFDYTSKDLSSIEVFQMIEDGKIFLAVQLINENENEKALEALHALTTPYASFYQGEIYKKLAAEQVNSSKENLTSEMRSKHIILLSKARDCFNLTLDRLKANVGNGKHPLDQILATYMEEVEGQLSRIDPDTCVHRNECEMSEDNMSSAGSLGEQILQYNLNSSYTNNSYAAANMNSTPKHKNKLGNSQFFRTNNNPINYEFKRIESRPSPERLDAQIRSLTATREKDMATLVDFNKIIFEEIKNLKDVINDLKIEVGELRKSSSKTKPETAAPATALDDNDFGYLLDEELQNEDFNVQNQLYGNFPSRTPTQPAFPYVNPMYPPSLYSMYPYAQLGAQGIAAQASGFEQQQLQDYRNQVLAQQMYSQAMLGKLNHQDALFQAMSASLYPKSDNNMGSNIPRTFDPSLAGIYKPPDIPLGAPGVNQTTQYQMVTGAMSSCPPTNMSFVNTLNTQSNLQSSIQPIAAPKPAPINVVITSSDPLPVHNITPSQPALSVTIPPQHIKGSPIATTHKNIHNYHINMPNMSTANEKPFSISSTLSEPAKVEVIKSGIQNKQTFPENSFVAPMLPPTARNDIPKPPTIPNQAASAPKSMFSFPKPSPVEKQIGLTETELKNNINIKKDEAAISPFGFGDKFKPKAGSWQCTACYTQNNKTNLNCASCQTPMESIGKNTSLLAELGKEKQNIGGFSFTNPNSFRTDQTKIIESKIQAKPDAATSVPSTPFSGFSFVKTDIPQTNAFANLKFVSSSNDIDISKPTAASIESKEDVTSSNQQYQQEEVDDFVPTAEFTPVIELPELIDRTTGEENESALFEERAKLLRFDAQEKQWKERGLGIMKILVDKNNAEKVRFLMRREIILKVCCNHYITKTMTFTKRPGKLESISWSAQDFSENEIKNEVFAIKFKTNDICDKFYKIILEAQSKITDSYVTKKEIVTSDFGDKFKPKTGTWECQKCYLSNVSDHTACIACKSPKEVPTSSESPKTVISTVGGWGDKFKPKAGTWPCKACYINNDDDKDNCVACNTPKNDKVATDKQSIPQSTSRYPFGIPTAGSGFNLGPQNPNAASWQFGIPQITTQKAISNDTKSKPSVFDIAPNVTQLLTQKTVPTKEPTGGFSFNIDQYKTDESAKTPFSFGLEPSGKKFEFNLKQQSPKVKTHKSKTDSDSDEECISDEEGEGIYFAPVIPLPDKVEVTTGEEKEEVMYCHRAKLYRFTDGEWKERGLGDIKLLRNNENKKIRLLMRRDQVLKICLNTWLLPELEFLEKDEKTWLFSAQDFSDGEVTASQFCIRFKNKDIAHDFKVAIDDAQEKLKEINEQDLNSNPIKSASEKSNEELEVQIIYEAKVSDEDKKLADKYLLPPTFYNYKIMEPCKGCRGCNSDDYVFRTEKSNPIKQSALSFGKINAAPVVEDKQLLFGKGFNSQNLSDQVTQTNKFKFSENYLSNSENVKSNIFGVKPSLQQSDKDTTGNGEKPTTLDTRNKSIFTHFSGSKSVFGMGDNSPFVTDNKISTQAPTTGNLFQPTPNTGFIPSSSNTIFGSTTYSNANKFGSTTTYSDISSKLPSTQDKDDEDVSFLPTDSNLSFANLAASTVTKPFTQTSDNATFSWSGAGAPLFSNIKKSTSKPKEDAEDSLNAEDMENNTVEEYDPHYEPIIDLPDIIEVSTGEENENKLFGERAKLYRYDTNTKEWKERGVGEIKILHHPENRSYRLLLRREQVHKLVLNQRITEDLELKPLNLSDRAWCWAGINHAEDTASCEELAIRFKNSELANAFKAAVNEAVQLQTLSNRLHMPNVNENNRADSTSTTEDTYREEYNYDYEDEDERSIMFEKRATLSILEPDGTFATLAMGDLQVVYDADMFGSRICMLRDGDNDDCVSNTVVAVNTKMTQTDKDCIWSAIDYAVARPVHRTLRARFGSVDAAIEFYHTYKEGLEYATEADIMDTVPDITPEED